MSTTHIRARTVSNSSINKTTSFFTTPNDDPDTILTHLSFGVFPSTPAYPHGRPPPSTGSALSSYISLSPAFENELPLPTPGAFPPSGEELPSSLMESAFEGVPMTPTMGGTSAFSPQLGGSSASAVFSPFGLEGSTASPRQRKGAGAGGGALKGSPMASSGLGGGRERKREKSMGEKEKEKERKARSKRNLSYGGTLTKGGGSNMPLAWTTVPSTSTKPKELPHKLSSKALSPSSGFSQVCDVSTQPFFILPQTRLLVSQFFSSFSSSPSEPTPPKAMTASTSIPSSSSFPSIHTINLTLIALFWLCLFIFLGALSGYPTPSSQPHLSLPLGTPYHSSPSPSLSDLSSLHLGPLDHDDTLTHPSPFAPNPLFKGFSASLSLPSPNVRTKSLEGKGLGYEWVHHAARSPFFFPSTQARGGQKKQGVAVGGQDGGEIGRRAMFWQRFGKSGGGPNGYGWVDEVEDGVGEMTVKV
jgi:hypothetical protein